MCFGGGGALRNGWARDGIEDRRMGALSRVEDLEELRHGGHWDGLFGVGPLSALKVDNSDGRKRERQ